MTGFRVPRTRRSRLVAVAAAAAVAAAVAAPAAGLQPGTVLAALGSGSGAHHDGHASDHGATEGHGSDHHEAGEAAGHHAGGHSHADLLAALHDPAIVQDEACGDGGALRGVDGGPVVCVHADEPPAGVDVHRKVPTAELLARDGASDEAVAAAAVAGVASPSQVAAASPNVVCDGDGTSGYRVQAMYVVPSGTTNRFSTLQSSIQTWAAGVDDVLNRSAALTGGVRHARFVTSSNGDGTCSPTVLNVTIPSNAASSFGATITAIQNAGYTLGNRKYLMWVDANVLCGIATLYPDSKATQNNNNNGLYAQYARIDNGCWGSGQSVEAHELVHTLGAVQGDSPHHTTNGHCWDEYDRMCYDDGSNMPMKYICASDKETLLDCNADDYFSTAPAGGSYLASHWNSADSQFLLGGGSGSGGGSTGPTSLGLSVAANPMISGLATQVSATIALPSGRTVTSVAWSATPATCRIDTGDDAAAEQVDLTCPVTQKSAVKVTAVVTDSTSATAKAVLPVAPTSDSRDTEVALQVNGEDYGAGPWCSAKGVLGASVTDAESGEPVYGLGVTFTRHAAGETKVAKAGSAKSDASGYAALATKLSAAVHDASVASAGAFTGSRTSSTEALTLADCTTALTVTTPTSLHVYYKQPVALRGTLLATAGGNEQPAAGQTVIVELRATGATKSAKVASARVDSDGAWSVTLLPTVDGDLTVRFPGGTGIAAATPVSVGSLSVGSWTTTLTANVARTPNTVGRKFTVTGGVTRTGDGDPVAAVGAKVQLSFTPTSGRATKTTATTKADGSFTAKVSFSGPGTLTVSVPAATGFQAADGQATTIS